MDGGDKFLPPRADAGTGRLLGLLSGTPLFTGMSVDELQRVVGKTKIDFIKVEPGHVVVRQGDKCGQLLMLIGGSLACHASTDDSRYAVSETMWAPVVLQLDGMFGLFQQFTHTFTAQTAASLISIDKKEILRLVSTSIVFRLNLINTLSTALQRKQYDDWRQKPADLAGRIALFMRRRCLTPSGPKTFHIKMETLAAELKDSRLNVSRTLNAMQGRGLLRLCRGRIEVPAMQDLIVAVG